MYDVTIVGCGVVGASLAYTLSQYRLRVLVLERENDVAMGTTKANSAIVHAGYDPENGTLMAKLNVRGSEVMEQLCSDLSVGYKRIGSFVLAFDEEQKQHLEHLLENGVRNGVPGLRILDAKEAHEMEPNLAENVVAALYAPSAAVIDPWGLCIAEAETAVCNGVELKLRSDRHRGQGGLRARTYRLRRLQDPRYRQLRRRLGRRYLRDDRRDRVGSAAVARRVLPAR